MKRYGLFVLMGAIVAVMVPGACGQSAYTDPVGVFKLAITAASSEEPSLEAFSIPLHAIPDDRGRITGLTATSLTDTDKTWTVDEYARTVAGHPVYYVELTDGAAGARRYEIVSNTADTLTIDSAGIDDPVAAGALAGDAYVIVPFYRIRDLFGEPGNGKLQGGDNAAEADNVLLWNGTGYDTIFYSTFFGLNTWKFAGGGPEANDVVIWPGEGFFIRRRAESDLTISVGGAVPVGERLTPVQGGDYTFVGMEFPAGVTLDSSELLVADGGPLTGGDGSDVADLVYAWNGTGYDIYYFSTFFGQNEWKKAGGGLSGSVTLEAGKGYFILELDETDVLDWPRTIPYPLP
jgi:uncharacterized protein (TIGR02597 family)